MRRLFLRVCCFLAGLLLITNFITKEAEVLCAGQLPHEKTDMNQTKH